MAHVFERIAVTVVFLAMAGLAGCCGAKMPTIAPAPNRVGVFARAVPADGARPPDARSGEVGASLGSWPPSPLYADCVDPHDELRDFEQSLAIASTACPSIQVASVAAVGLDAAQPHKGSNVYCYPLGGALLVVETTELLGSCKHIVGLAIYPRQVP